MKIIVIILFCLLPLKHGYSLIIIPSNVKERRKSHNMISDNSKVPSKISKYLGKVSNNGSCIYLGNRTVITANHVGPNKVYLNGKIYTPIYRTVRQLKNNNNAQPGKPDLLMFKIDMPFRDTLMLSNLLPITRKKRVRNETFYLAGCGFQASRSAYKNINTINYASRAITWANPGYQTWGRAKVELGERLWLRKEGMNSAIFYSKFDMNVPNYAQATSGDSGGGAFVYNKNLNRYELAGIIIAFLGKPGVSKHDNMSMICDITEYRSQINSFVNASRIN